MSGDVRIDKVAPAAVLPLRMRLLRPEATDPSDVVFTGDESPNAGHFVAFVDGDGVGCASVFQGAPRDGHGSVGFGPAGDWRLRGVAVEPGMQSQGVGTLLMDVTEAFAEAQGAGRLWCNARVGAVTFYERRGYVVYGAEFLTAGGRPHRFMELRFG